MGGPTKNGLKQQWGVTDPQVCSAGSSAQAVKFNASFKVSMDAINDCLQYTSANAEKPKHEAMNGKRDTLIQSFQAVIPKIDPDDESKAKSSIDGVLSSAQGVASEAKALKTATEKSVKTWQSLEAPYEKAVTRVEELEMWEDKDAPELRETADETQKDVNERKYDDAVVNFKQLLTNLKPVYEEYQKQLAAKTAYDPAWNALQPRLEAALAVQFEGEKTKACQWEISNARLDMENVAEHKDYVSAKGRLDNLPATLEKFDKTYKEEKESIKYFQPKFSVAETSFDADLNVEKEFLVQFENAPDLAPEAKFTFEWEEPAAAAAEFKLDLNPAPAAKGVPAPVATVGIPAVALGPVATKQSTGIFKIKTGMGGSLTLKYFVSAKQDSDTERWEVPQTTAVTVKQPEMSGTADTGKKYNLKDKATVKVQFKNINKASELLRNSVDVHIEAESVRSIAGDASSFRDPWGIAKQGWEGDSTYAVELRADHAGAATVQIRILHPPCNALQFDAKFEVVSKFADFVKALDATGEAKSTIAASVSTYLTSLLRKLQTALASHEAVIKADNDFRPMATVGAVVSAVPAAGVPLTVIKVGGGLAAKLADAGAVQQTATKLVALSKDKLGANLVIAAAQYRGFEPTVANLPSIESDLKNALILTMDNSIMAWRNWVKDGGGDNEKAVPFDPSDALTQSATVGGVRVLDLPGDTGNPKEYEADIWKLWVKSNANYFTFGTKSFAAHDATGPITPIRTRLKQLGVDYPK